MKRSSPTLTTETQILDFWLGDAATSADLARKRKQLWYRSGPELDQKISEQFGSLLQAASRGELDELQSSDRGRVALVILLDQFSRHIYRGTPKAFSQDAKALEVTLGITNHRLLAEIERAFVYHPLEHSESREMQAISVARFAQLTEDASEEWKPMMSEFYRHACQHRDIIEKFGRFPHRNAILGRTNTAAEQQFLSEGGATFGQKAKE